MKTTLRIVAAACIASGMLFTSAAHADFSGSYAPAKATTTGGGTVTPNAPTDITIVRSNAVGDTDYTFKAPMNGTVSFDWQYSTFDASASRDPFSYLINGTAFVVYASASTAIIDRFVTGSMSFSVNNNDTFGFRLGSNGGGANPTTNVNISNFSGPVPEPETYLLMGLGAFGLAYARRRQQKNKDQAQAPQMEPVSA